MVESAGLTRFWDQVTLIKKENMYHFLLDSHLLKLPQKSILQVRHLSLANEIVKEWQKAGEKKGGKFTYESLPLTRLAGTMIEKISQNREVYINALLPYVNGDLLCYRADKPKQLVERQKKDWDPLIEWINKKYQVSLKIAYGVMPITQNEETARKFNKDLEQFSDGELTAFAELVPLLGSMILAVALKDKRITVKEAFNLAYLDEAVQSQIWGQDHEQQQRLDKVQKELEEAADFLFLISEPVL